MEDPDPAEEGLGSWEMDKAGQKHYPQAGGTEMMERKSVPLGAVIIAVVMFFAAVATDIFWLGRLFAGAFPPTLPIDKRVYNAFAGPDIILALFLYVGAYGLLKMKRIGFVAALVALGMWLFDALLILGLTGLARIGFLGPSLFFAAFAIIYLWVKRDLFS